MLSLFIWIAAHAAEALFCLWVLRWGGAEDAHKLILEGIERAKKK